jgi:putative ABC transport system permease protein
MWLISARDLQFRLRRFVVAVMVTGLVFGIALVFDGVKRAMRNEGPRIVQSFGADEWVVADGASGPFTATKVFPASAGAALRDDAGVRRADPVVLARSVVATHPDKDVNLIGYLPDGLGRPSISQGRAVRRNGEVVIGAGVDAEVGDRLGVGGARMRVVGKTEDSRFFFGNSTAFVTLRDAQALMFGGEQLVMAIAVVGHVATPPAGLDVQSIGHVEADLDRPIKPGIETVDFVNLLLWVIAAGIIASIV